MFSVIYDFFLGLFVCIALPKYVWQLLFFGKYKNSFKSRFGWSNPLSFSACGRPVIWLHACSVGETKAMVSLFQTLLHKHPDAAIVVSSTTETGHEEAKRSLKGASSYFYLPLDFSWIMRRLVRQIQPHILILCESDFWYHLIKNCRSHGAAICLVNGKISERSMRRFQHLSWFSKRLFSVFDVLCVQSQEIKQRFCSLGIGEEKLIVTGNLKLDTSSQEVKGDIEVLRGQLGIQRGDLVVVLGSTHHPEEELLLDALAQVRMIFPSLKVLVVPRHPERFHSVADVLKRKGAGFSKYSALGQNHLDTPSSLILIDVMGLLRQCYALADVAIVGGSFIPQIGGHNVFEPVALGTPVLFGPYVHNQVDLSQKVLEAHAGVQLVINEVAPFLLDLLSSQQSLIAFKNQCLALSSSVQGASSHTYSTLARTVLEKFAS